MIWIEAVCAQLRKVFRRIDQAGHAADLQALGVLSVGVVVVMEVDAFDQNLRRCRRALPRKLGDAGLLLPSVVARQRRADVPTDHGDVPPAADTERVRVDVAKDDTVLGAAVEPVVEERPIFMFRYSTRLAKIVQAGNGPLSHDARV